MSTASLWLVPVSIIPGLGMLVLSTSARYMTVALQLREQGKEETPDLWLSELIFKRACCLQQALVGLYISIALFVIASLLTASTYTADLPESFSKWVMLAGGVCTLYATLHLAYEVITSRKIVNRDYSNLQQKSQ
jgi:hypothetical protein